MFLGVLMLRGVMQYFNSYLTQWIGQRTIFDLRMEIFTHLQRLSLKFYDRNPIGRLITRVTNDVEVLNECSRRASSWCSATSSGSSGSSISCSR